MVGYFLNEFGDSWITFLIKVKWKFDRKFGYEAIDLLMNKILAIL